ncbi:GGDEF domain-containing protein [Planctomycetales bacterium ZRK34]|nr:GGDEF domain-containing protein [Planctomycetales bacterium ZRK34]
MSAPDVSNLPITIVVADAPLAERLRQTAPKLAPIVAVDGYLDALGEMSRRPARAVVGRVAPLEASLDATAGALRRLAPEAQLLLVCDADQEPDAMRAVRLGFDDYFIEPLADDHLLEALTDHDNGDDDDLPQPEPDITPAPTPPHADAEAQPKRLVSRQLGDIDLVEQLLRDRSGLRDLAVRLIIQRLGHDDIRWTEAPDKALATNVPVTFANQTLGHLASNTVPAAELTGYANWLARWATLEKHLSHLSDLALHDQLTGVWNRRYFDKFLKSIIERAHVERFRVTLMLYDIDNFKAYNDRYGHPAGDEILVETARLMTEVVRKHDIVARIGGDEFAVIFWDAEPPRRESSEHPHSVRTAAERFQKAVCQHRYPKLAEQAHGTLTISGGLASYPWDGQTPEQLIDLADEMLLESKKQGKNALTFGPGAMRACGLLDDTPDNTPGDTPTD